MGDLKANAKAKAEKTKQRAKKARRATMAAVALAQQGTEGRQKLAEMARVAAKEHAQQLGGKVFDAVDILASEIDKKKAFYDAMTPKERAALIAKKKEEAMAKMSGVKAQAIEKKKLVTNAAQSVASDVVSAKRQHDESVRKRKEDE